MSNPYVDKVIDYLWHSTQKYDDFSIYTILDTARDDRIYKAIVNFHGECICLFRGSLARQLASVAPYLIKLNKDDPFTYWLLSHGWGESWGIFIKTRGTLKELRSHFRKFLMVYDEEGRPLYFRYYDPRVLRVYLPSCNEKDLKTLFGPVNYYLMENQDEKKLIEFAFKDERNLSENIIKL